ncbi:MAG: rod shape-determining protein RodA [Parcubacteria group bacterium]|nr:rod shape-determining protein RodA [Parcubacteria group bacterium]
MISLRTHVQHLDWVIIGIVVLISTLGLLSLYSIGNQTGYVYFYRQLVWVGLGLGTMIAVSFIDYRMWRVNTPLVLTVYAVCVLLLGFLLVFAPRIRGVTTWFRFGAFGFSPVEFVKVAIVIVLAKYFSHRHVDLYRIRHLIVSGLYVGVPAILALLQPDFGSFVIFAGVWVSIIFLSGIQKRHVIILLVTGVAIGAVFWSLVFRDYQRARILTFLHPEGDPLGWGYQVIQSRIAIGSGKLWGSGLGHGSQVQYGFLPEAHTDFIFAAIAEEWGFAGVLFLLGLMFFLFMRMMSIAFRALNNFARLTIGGFIAILSLHVIINAGMNLGIFPVTGIPFPFLSYGGSSILAYGIALGVVQNISLHNRVSGTEEELLLES